MRVAHAILSIPITAFMQVCVNMKEGETLEDVKKRVQENWEEFGAEKYTDITTDKDIKHWQSRQCSSEEVFPLG